VQTTIWAGPDTKIVDLTSNDNGTSAVIPHGLGETPADVALTALQTLAAVNLWRVSAMDATNVTVSKTEDESGESATAQLRVIIRRPHSIGR
jgi:hypothetical protein